MKLKSLIFIFALLSSFFNSAEAAIIVPYKCKIAPNEVNNNGVPTFGYLIVYDLTGPKSKVMINNPTQIYSMENDTESSYVVLTNDEYGIKIDKKNLDGVLIIFESGVHFDLECEANASIGR